MSNVPKIVTAAAAAILLTDFDQVDEQGEPIDTKYHVHPHVAIARLNEPALLRYLEDIYSSGSTSIEMAQEPASAAFRSLEASTDVTTETRQIADDLCARMQSTNARAGIVFGFRLKLNDGTSAFGIIKADIEDNRRFHLNLDRPQWTIESVSEVLTLPSDKYAKFAISPQPLGSGVVGIRDRQAQSDSAAAYFLSALGVAMPKTEGTKLAVAQTALRAGRSHDEIRVALSDLEEDVAPREFVESWIPDIDDSEIEKLEGPEERPMPAIRASEPLVTEWHTTEPYFSLRADASVTVAIEGNRITATLPDDHGDISERFIKRR